MWKHIIKGVLKGLGSSIISIVIPLWLISSIGSYFERALYEGFQTQYVFIVEYNLEAYFALIIFLSAIIGVLEESNEWRILGKSLRLGLFVISFLLIYTILDGGVFSRTVVVNNVVAEITIDLRLILYAYGFFIVLPTVIATLIDMFSITSKVLEK